MAENWLKMHVVLELLCLKPSNNNYRKCADNMVQN